MNPNAPASCSPQLVEVAGHGPAPEAHVDVHLVAGDVALDLQRLHVDRRRDAVQRHVQDRGHTARGGGLGGGREALPLGAARLVHVHMRVDQARDQGLVVGELDDPVRREVVAQRLHRDDHAVADAHLAGADAGAGQDPLAADHQVVVLSGGVVLILRHVGRILSSGESRSCFVGFHCAPDAEPDAPAREPVAPVPEPVEGPGATGRALRRAQRPVWARPGFTPARRARRSRRPPAGPPR